MVSWALIGMAAFCLVAAFVGGLRGGEGMGAGFGVLAVLMVIFACIANASGTTP